MLGGIRINHRERTACLLMVLDEELAGLELVRIHDVQQLLPRSIVLFQVLPVELLHPTFGFSPVLKMADGREPLDKQIQEPWKLLTSPVSQACWCHVQL